MLEHLRTYFVVYLRLFVGISFLFLSYFTYKYISTRRSLNTHAQEFGKVMVSQSAQKIDSVLISIESAARGFANKLGSRPYSTHELEKEMKELALSQPYVLGVTVAYKPFAFQRDRRLYAPFYHKKKSEIVQTEKLYDYTDKSQPANSDWFYAPIERDGPGWCEPGYGIASEAVVAEFGIPFHDPQNKKEIIGIVDVTFSLEGFNKLLNSLHLGKNGFGLMISQKGNILSHPRKDYMKALLNISQISKDTSESYQEIAKHFLAKEEGIVEHYDKHLARKNLFFFKSIMTTKWRLGLVVVKEELFNGKTNSYHLLLAVIVAGTFFFGLLSILLLKLYVEQRIWYGISVISTFLFAGIALIWHMHNRKPLFYDIDPGHFIITDENSVHIFQTKNDLEAIDMHETMPSYIPTGVYIQNIELKEGRQIGISGVIWQKYDLQLHNGLERGFVFPDISTDAEAYTVDTTYHIFQKGQELIGWNFRINLLNSIDYRLYPFDRKKVAINLQHKSLGKNIFLIPDREGYETFLPHLLPGINKNLLLTGWNLKGSYYSYHYKNYHTNFGIDNFQRERKTPELSFNIVMRRKIVGPLITHIIPLIVILIMQFGLIIIFTKKNTEASGYNSFGVINSCAAFFFVVVLSHIDLRNTLEVEMVTYVEYIYFVVYLYILLVTINSILFSAERDYPFIDFKDNHIPKLLYWPVFLLTTFTFTFILFY